MRHIPARSKLRETTTAALPGTGPAGATCVLCDHFLRNRVGEINGPGICQKAPALFGDAAKPLTISGTTPACRYWTELRR